KDRFRYARPPGASLHPSGAAISKHLRASGAVAADHVPTMHLASQRKEDMPRIATVDHARFLEIVLLGDEMRRSRIQAAMREIQAGLGQSGTTHRMSALLWRFS